MTGLTLALNNALSGLNVSQQSLATLSQNIANANTKGYSRQIVNQQSVYLDGQGSGVSIKDITRKIDQYLVQASQLQTSNVGEANVISDYAGRIQLLLGQPGNTNSIDAFINDFFNNVHALAQTPQDTTLQRTAVNSGVTLAGQMHQLSDGLNTLQFQADQDITAAINTLNTDLNNLSQLNTTIVNALSLGKSVADLEDQRDGLLADIGQYIDIHTFKKDNGQVSVTTTNGISLLDDSRYQIIYHPTVAAAAFSSDSPMSPIQIQRLDAKGNNVGTPVTLVTGGTVSQIASTLRFGKLQGLLDIRDQQIPDIISQLDTMANNLRDEFNKIHNQGSGYPGASQLTGTRAIGSQEFSQWSGSVRIAVLQANGLPLISPYPDEPNGYAPLTIDLSALNSGLGAGNPTNQTIIDEINQYFAVPQNKAEISNLNNVRLVSDSTVLPGSPPTFSFDLDLQNLSATTSKLFVTGIHVKDNNGVDITSVTQNVPTIALDPVNTYVTTAGSDVVTINTAGPNTLSDGMLVQLSDPGAPVDGIPSNSLSGFFIISNVTTSSFQIHAVNAVATAGITTGIPGQTMTLPYGEVPPGGDIRTLNNGALSVDLSGNSITPFYNITVDVAVSDNDGVPVTGSITYNVTNNQNNLLNYHYAAQFATGNAEIIAPTSGRNQPLARALMVDANGNELARVNGQYTTLVKGYLRIQAADGTFIAIDSLDSNEQGQPTNDPPVPGTNRGFSWYYDLNDFFKSNALTTSGDSVHGSALNLAVNQAIVNNASLMSMGNLIQGTQPNDPNAPPNYTYERNAGDNSIIQRLSTLGINTLGFVASGGLGQTTQTFAGYAGQIIGTASSNASTATTTQTNAQTLLDGYTQRASAISGVKLDDELANTIIYQNAYAASARVITVANDLFNTLLQAFQ